jgi:hypothetical protein
VTKNPTTASSATLSSCADFAWQEYTHLDPILKGVSLATSYNTTPSEKDTVQNNEIDGLMDVLDDMIIRTPAVTREVSVPRALSSTTVGLDNDDMDFTDTLHLFQAPQSQGPEQLPFRNRSNATSHQQHLPLKSPTSEHIRFKLVTKTSRSGIYQLPWATSTAGATRDLPSTTWATQRGN